MDTRSVPLENFPTFGELLKYLRKRAQLSQRELSIAVGYSESQISRLEANLRVPDQATLMALFVPALAIEQEPETIRRLSELARRGNPKAPGQQANEPGTAYPHHFPAQLTSFIGREDQIDSVCMLLESHRLVTLTGSGGVGKTRLAIKVAEELLGRYQDGIWFVELASVTDPGLVPQTIASILGLKAHGSQSIRQILLEYLHAKQALVVLDNCEHQIDACAALAGDLLQTCMGLKILATSREALWVEGEMPFRVPSMTLPELSHLTTLELTRITLFESIRLFIERAGAVQGNFRVTAGNAQVIAQICQRLDGIPLAIELAAARLNVLSVEQLASRLDNVFRLLANKARSALPRHQTLRATIDWSYELLSEAEKKLLRRMAVFAGSFDVRAVEAVCCIDEIEQLQSLDSLASLVRKSVLILDDFTGPEACYHLLETVRQYVREKLDDSGETSQVLEHHAAYYLDLAQQGGLHIFSKEAVIWLRRLDADFSNIRAAFAWNLDSQSPEKGISALRVLWYYWPMRGIMEEERIWLEKYLNHLNQVQSSAERAGLLCSLGYVAVLQDWPVKGHEYFIQSREMFKELGDSHGYAEATRWLITTPDEKDVRIENRDMHKSEVYLNESAAIFRELGDEENLALSLWIGGVTERDLGDQKNALSHLKESYRLFQKLGSWMVSVLRYDLARLYHLTGQTRQARRLFRQALPGLIAVDDQYGQMWAYYFMCQLELEEATDQERLHEVDDILKKTIAIAEKFGRQGVHNIFYRNLLAEVNFRLGDLNESVRNYREALTYILEHHFFVEYSLEIGKSLFGLAEAGIHFNQPEFSARLLAMLQKLRDTPLYLWKNISTDKFDRLVETIRLALGDEHLAALWVESQAMTLERVIAYALEENEFPQAY